MLGEQKKVWKQLPLVKKLESKKQTNSCLFAIFLVDSGGAGGLGGVGTGPAGGGGAGVVRPALAGPGFCGEGEGAEYGGD